VCHRLEYDSGDYPRTLALALEMAGYESLRVEQAARPADGPQTGIGISFFTEAVGAGPRATMDIPGSGMADAAELRIHPTGSAMLAVSCVSQGQCHETTFAQIVAEELGIPPDLVDVVQGDTDRTPFGLGTYGSRSARGGARDGHRPGLRHGGGRHPGQHLRPARRRHRLVLWHRLPPGLRGRSGPLRHLIRGWSPDRCAGGEIAPEPHPTDDRW
jgi:hypothetical protein